MIMKNGNRIINPKKENIISKKRIILNYWVYLCGSLCFLCVTLCNIIFSQRTAEKTQRITEVFLYFLPVTSTTLSIFLINPCKTSPGPNSTNCVAPFFTIF